MVASLRAHLVALLFALCGGAHATAQGEEDGVLEFRATADTGICAHPAEMHFAHGSKASLRLKGNEHFVLLRFDLRELPMDRHPRRARLHVRVVSPTRPQWIGVSSVASPWSEGGSTGADASGATFLEAASGGRTWAGEKSSFLDASFGEGGSAWEACIVRREEQGWISIALPPWLIRAMRESQSDGLALSDEKGQTRANHDIASRERGEAARLALWDFAPEPPLLPDRLRSPAQSPVPIAAPLVALETWSAREPNEVALGAQRVRVLPSLRAWDALEESRAGPELERDHRAGEAAPRLVLHAHPGGSASLALRVPPLAVPLSIAAEGELSATVFLGVALPCGNARRIDPLLDLGMPPIALPASSEERVLLVEWRVPRAASALREGALAALRFETAEAQATLGLKFRIGARPLPASLHFHLSLNTYGRPAEDPALELAFHRLAHRHRATLAVVPYSQAGAIGEDLAPELGGADTGATLDFTRFAARYGAYFDGEAFADEPRTRVPIDHWIAPFHENWPTPLEPSYAWRGEIERHALEAPPIEQAFSAAYAAAWRAALLAWYDEIKRRGWLRTRFHVFLNNKVDFRRSGRGTSWWLLDEPAYRDDFLALRWFADLHRAALPAEARAHLPFRIDLSRPQFRREHLDGRIDLAVNNAARWWPSQSLRPVEEAREALWSYGEAPAPDVPPERCAAWIFDAFATGCDGLVPWQSIGRNEDWSRPSALALLLPPTRAGGAPAPTLRLKALRDAVEDVECALAWIADEQPLRSRELRWRFSRAILPALGLRPAERLRADLPAQGLLDGARLEALLALRRALVLEPARLLLRE